MTIDRWAVVPPPLFSNFHEARTRRQKLRRMLWPLVLVRRIFLKRVGV